MKDTGEHPDTERLLQLASTLVRDSQQAEDVVQDAWVRGLNKRTGAGGLSTAYLRATIKNGVHNLFRDRDRRERRERDVARDFSTSSTLDELETGEFRRILVEAIDGLREPYRSTITHRFFDDLTPKEIASRKGVPDATVRSHLKRGLDGLRESLDSRYGRTSWIGGFALVVERETGTSPLAAGELATRAPASVGAGSGALPVTVAAVALTAVVGFFGARELLANEGTSEPGLPADSTGGSASVPARFAASPGTVVAPNAPDDTQRNPAGTAGTHPALDRDAARAASSAPDPGVLLHVHDARTRVALDDVRVVSTPMPDYAPPRTARLDDVEPRDSPFVIARSRSVEPDALVQCIWVGAPGYAWQRVLIDRSDPAASVERRVFLEPGAPIELSLTGFDESGPPDGLVLFVRDADGRLLWETGVDSDRMRLDEVPIGRISLSVGKRAPAWGEASNDRMYAVRGADIVLGATEVDTIPGRVTEAVLAVTRPEPSASPERVTFSLSLPANANSELYRELVSVRVRPFEERLRVPVREFVVPRFDVRVDEGGRDVAASHALSLVPGRYEVEVAPFCDRHVVEVAPGAPIDITVPPLAEVRVRMNGAPVEALFFHRQLEEFHAPIASKWDVDPGSDECAAWLVPGRYSVQAVAPGEFASALPRLEIEVDSGWNVADFSELGAKQATTILEIEFRCAGALIPFDKLPFAIEPVGHAGRAYESGMAAAKTPGRHLVSGGWGVRDSTRELVTRVLLTEPGEYEVAKFDCPSFLSVPARRVSLRAGETRRIVYELVPR